ncbi:RNA polymerase alpha subunit C-terminal domain-containing protein [Dyadobacter arcticus]|uniref:RecB family nuclease n=1 Tax=Dyadobacter arcticus TaxID=1078754 RepID=A0ABX0UKU2_9BACT|nr:RNA polymerase alpha subunit C-terminal domain-containing protein [Dyadobacter arcticus]NIJ53618.1 putative RecB family nuclease [Dyadobacter arcticus]
MEKKKGTLRTCPNGHRYYKSSDCPVCPLCAEEQKPETGFLSLLSAPARRALENHGISTLKQLSEWTEKDVRQFHGIGPTAIPKLQKALEENGLHLKP